MKRTLLIARREYLSYVRTVGFWLSLLALPFFAALGGVVPILMQRAEPVHAVALVEAPSDEAASLAEGLRQALESVRDREAAEAMRAAATVEAGPEAADAVREIAETEGREAGLAELRRVAPNAAAGFTPPDRKSVV